MFVVYAVTHRSKLWGRVVARCYALDDGLPPKALRNLDLLALDGALASSIGKRIDFTNMVDAVVVSIYNGVLVCGSLPPAYRPPSLPGRPAQTNLCMAKI